MPTENAIKAAVVQRLKAEGAYVFKVHGSAMVEAGTPDLLVCYAGRFVGMELKQKGSYPTRIQRARMRQIEEAGGVAGVVRSAGDALALLRRAADVI